MSNYCKNCLAEMQAPTNLYCPTCLIKQRETLLTNMIENKKLEDMTTDELERLVKEKQELEKRKEMINYLRGIEKPKYIC